MNTLIATAFTQGAVAVVVVMLLIFIFAALFDAIGMIVEKISEKRNRKTK